MSFEDFYTKSRMTLTKKALEKIEQKAGLIEAYFYLTLIGPLLDIIDGFCQMVRIVN